MLKYSNKHISKGKKNQFFTFNKWNKFVLFSFIYTFNASYHLLLLFLFLIKKRGLLCIKICSFQRVKSPVIYFPRLNMQINEATNFDSAGFQLVFSILDTIFSLFISLPIRIYKHICFVFSCIKIWIAISICSLLADYLPFVSA